MRGGEAIIESLKTMGVETIFGYPGGQTIPFYDMLYDADINHILVRHNKQQLTQPMDLQELQVKLVCVWLLPDRVQLT